MGFKPGAARDEGWKVKINPLSQGGPTMIDQTFRILHFLPSQEIEFRLT